MMTNHVFSSVTEMEDPTFLFLTWERYDQNMYIRKRSTKLSLSG